MKRQSSELIKTHTPPRETPHGTGPNSAGQSGDTQGLSNLSDADSESVEELMEEGQAFEAEAVLGVENASNADEGPVRTKQLREDDVPREYDHADGPDSDPQN